MATMAFDTLRYARRLREAGVPEPQADVQAELMAEAFGFYADNLLTRDHFTEVLNAHFAEQEARIDARFAEQDARMDVRFAEQEAKLDARFAEQEARMDARFVEQAAKFDARFSQQDVTLEQRFAAQDGKFEARFVKLERRQGLHTWVLGLNTVAVVLPQLQAWLA